MSHPVDQHVGKRLRELRNRLGMSQEALAKSSGITFQQVQKYERATNRISVSRIFEFAHTLKVPVSYFFDGIEGEMGLAESTTPFQHEDKSMEKEVRDLVNSYRRIENPETRKSVKTLVKAVATGATIL